jgi:hypothetical protein
MAETGATAGVPPRPSCRFCGSPLTTTFVDLGMSPLCESFVPPERLDSMEPFFPLHVRVCDECFLVQLPECVAPEEIFVEYAYFSGYSTSWVEHAGAYVREMTEKLSLSSESFVVELASNDGYLLQHFLGTGIPILGVEPARNVAAVAVERGIPTLVDFFGDALARRLVAERGRADLVVANNVLAQVPDLNDFVAGVSLLLAPEGTATFEFPHLLRLIEGLQYDTIYHEHFSYFSLETVAAVLLAHGLEVYDVQELPTHGGSLRVFAGHREAHEPTPAPAELVAAERDRGLRSTQTYARFAEDVKESKRALLDLLIRLRRSEATVAAYGAPGKGNTLLNYCGIRTDLVEFTVDRNPYKHGLHLPGTHIPIFPPEHLAEKKPDYIVVLPWNLFDEISAQLSYASEWSAKLVVPIPFAAVRDPGEASRR